jgi:P27 family predicted phage terminase small subunit
MLKEHGRISYVEKMGEDGNKYYEAKASPAAVQYNNLLSQFRAFSGMLGLDPASRPKIIVPGPDGDNEADIFD